VESGGAEQRAHRDGGSARAVKIQLSSFFFSSRRRHTRLVSDWSSDVCSSDLGGKSKCCGQRADDTTGLRFAGVQPSTRPDIQFRSEEHTSELQSLTNLVCRLLLEKKKDQSISPPTS